MTGMSIDRANRSQVYYFEDGYSANLDANGEPAQDNREYRDEKEKSAPANEADNLIALKIEALRFASIVPGATADSLISAAEAIKTWLLAPPDPEPEAETVPDPYLEARSEATGADLSALWAETGLEATPPREAPSSLA